MKGSSFERVLGFEEEKCVFIIIFLPYMGMRVDGVSSFEQTLNPVSQIRHAHCCNLECQTKTKSNIANNVDSEETARLGLYCL